MLPSNSSACCGTTAQARRSEARVTAPIGTPSMRIDPACGSRKRCSSATTVDLPAPVAPTSAVVRPAGRRRSKPASTGGPPS